MSSFTGVLAETSTLRAVFPDARVPLNRSARVMCKLGGSESPTPCYMLSTAAITDAQKDALAQLMQDGGLGPKDEALAFIVGTAEVPIREFHFVGQPGAELRQFI